jgi:Bacterial archaeo-eukaryotic release factor family 3
MDTAKVEVTNLQNQKDLKALLSSPGPCVSVYMTPKLSEKASALEWEETVRRIEPKLQELGNQGRELREALGTWETISQGEPPKGKSVAVFGAQHTLRVMWLADPVGSRAVVGPRFYIRPLVPALWKARPFYILALSQNDVRLLRCTSSGAQEVQWPNGTAASFGKYMDTAKPDHQDTNETSAGPSAGHTKGIVGSTSTVREDKPQYLANFFRQIDRAVNELLRGGSDPLVLAAVEYELALYRSLNSYPHLLDEDAQGAPNGLKAGEMHARALEALTRSYEKKTDAVLAEYDHKVGGGASNRLKDVVKAAHEGRVLTLLVSDSLENTGVFDEQTYSAKGGATGTSEEEDLVNDAAVQTLLHGGQVFSTANKRMPNGAPVAAIFRY